VSSLLIPHERASKFRYRRFGFPLRAVYLGLDLKGGRQCVSKPTSHLSYAL
jgi:hypothetical protein